MTYKDIKFILDNIREENKSLDLYNNEFVRMNNLLIIEKQKIKQNKDRIIALEKHLKNIKDFHTETLLNRTIIINALTKINEPYSSIILDRFFERKSFEEIEIKYHYPITTIKKYIERGIQAIEKVIKNETL